jgi:ribosomal protein S18 acetylase RimI-like enzyme
MIRLRKMSNDEYFEYLKFSIPLYAEEKMKGEGLTPEYALKVAQESFDRILPLGHETENQFLYSIVHSDSSQAIGMMWFAKKTDVTPHYAYFYDLFLQKEFRGKGMGQALVPLAEAEVRRLGLGKIVLHVFEHNRIAIGLYEKNGFRTTNRFMAKDL